MCTMSPGWAPAARSERATSCAQVAMSLRVQPHDLLAPHGEHAERIVLAQIVLGGEGEVAQVGELFQVLGMHAGALALAAIRAHLLIGMTERPLEARQLQRAQLLYARPLDRLEGG